MRSVSGTTLVAPGWLRRARPDVASARTSWISHHFGPLAYLTALVSIFYSPYLRSGTVQWDGVVVH